MLIRVNESNFRTSEDIYKYLFISYSNKNIGINRLYTG